MQIKEELVKKLFLNQCTQDELETLLEIIKNDPSDTGPDIMLELQDQLKANPKLEKDLSNEIYALIEKKRKSNPAVVHKMPFNYIKNRKRIYWWFSSAAAIMLMIFCLWVLFSPPKVKQMAYQTAYGEVQEYLLPDSSIVILNGNSSIRFLNQWQEGATRIVELEGEAFFQVRKKIVSKAKFQVVTNDLTVEVLGTHFNVNTRQKETEVFLEEGKIQVQLEHQQDQTIDLIPGEGLRYSAEQSTSPAEKFTLDQTPNWRKGFMQFNEESLATILNKIAMSHKLEFTIPDSTLAATKYTLTLPISNMDDTMDVLSKSVGITITKRNGEYEIVSE